MVQAHAWWRLKGLAVDLVIWNEERDVYRQRLQEQILGLIAAGIEAHVVDRPGGIFVRHAEQIAGEDRMLLQAVARAIVSDRNGSLVGAGDAQAARRAAPATLSCPRAPPSRRQPGLRYAGARELGFFNGFGGFAPDGREYVIAPPAGHRPPAPWVNVLANPRFGTVVSEAGSAYTWCENAHELRLTPWHNDPVTDAGGEAIYLRDEERGQVWSPTSLPGLGDPRDDSAALPYRRRHGFGYSVFEHDEAAVHSELTVFVALDDAVKFSRLVLRNDSGRAAPPVCHRLRRMGARRPARRRPRRTSHTEIASDNGALYARNRYSNDFGDWIAFFDVDDADRASGTVTCDRDRIHRPQRVAAAPGRAASRAALPAASAPASTPARRSRWRSSWRPGRRARSSFASAWAAAPTKPASWCSAFAAASASAGRPWTPCMRTGSTHWARCR